MWSSRQLRLRPVLSVIAFGLAACGGDSPSDPEPVSTTSVSVRDNFFDPVNIVVSPGATVNWSWVGSNPHDVTWDEADLADSSTQTSGSHAVTVPSAPGEYGYHCTVHVAQGMRGTVVVEGN